MTDVFGSIGAVVAPPPPPPRTETDDLRLFVGPNVGRFEQSLQARGFRRLNWKEVCWPAFFAPIPWFLYRKMYACAAAAAVVPTIAQTAFKWPGLQSAVGVAVSLVALRGHMFYVSHARRVVGEIRRDVADESEARALIARAGGVSIAGAWIGAIIMIALVAAALVARWLGKPA
jgi:hypothetical protein